MQRKRKRDGEEEGEEEGGGKGDGENTTQGRERQNALNFFSLPSSVSC